MTTDRDKVLAYYEADAKATGYKAPVPPVKLDKLRSIRTKLVAEGELERTPEGRYIPTNRKTEETTA